MQNYTIKTRNWQCRRWVMHCLNLSRKWGVDSAVPDDGDGKYFLHTTNPFKAWLTFAYFMSLRRWSGGWTYIIRPGHNLRPGYKAIN